MVKQFLWFVLVFPSILVHAGEESLVGKTFELRQPVFLYYSTVFDAYVLEPPGFSPEIPDSIALFEQYGENWRRYDKEQSFRNRSMVQKEFMEIMCPGTRIYVTSMQRKRAVMFDVWVPIGRVDDSRFNGMTFQLIGLLRDARTDEPRIDTEYLIPVIEDRRGFQ